MKKKTLSLYNKFLALIIIALGVCSCKVRQQRQQRNQQSEPRKIEIVEDTIRRISCKYGVRPVPFDTLQRDTTQQQPKDTVRRVVRRPNPGAIRALYGVFPTEFRENDEN